MPNTSAQRNIGAYVQHGQVIVLNDSGTTTNGASLDRSGKLSAVIMAQAGAASGTPTTQTYDVKLQDSADGTTFADITTVTSAVTQITADDTVEVLDIELTNVRKFVRLSTTVAFTGGTSPAWPCAATLVLGGGDVLPLAD